MTSLKVQLERFHGLSAAEKWILVRAVAQLSAISVALRWMSLARLTAWAFAPVAVSSAPREAIAVRRLAYLIDVANRLAPFRANCLGRSLLLAKLLHQHDVACHLVVGVRKEAGLLKAHAWIECAGFPVNESAEVVGQFARIASGDEWPQKLLRR